MVEDTAANVRPIIRETSRLPQSYSIAVGAKRKKCTSTAGRVSRSATAFNFCILGQIRLRRHLVIGSQGRQPFPGGDAAPQNRPKPALQAYFDNELIPVRNRLLPRVSRFGWVLGVHHTNLNRISGLAFGMPSVGSFARLQ